MRWVAVNGVLLLLVALAIGGLELGSRNEAAVESSVRRYAQAVTDGDLDAAMAEIAPAERGAWTDWVSGQLGNVYEVRGIAVRAPSPLARLLQHAAPGPTEVTVVMDVDRGYADQFYSPTTRVPLERGADGRWYLAEPLLAPEASGQ
jgi:hypothetical protein